MTLLELKDYFEDYAKKHVELRHDPTDDKRKSFYCLNTEDKANEYVRNSPMDLVMLLMTYDKAQTPPAGENYNWDKNMCFFVLKRCEPSDNDAIIAAQSQCEVIADDFCTVMIADRTTKLSSLVSGSVTMSPIGPVVNSHYGYICMFNIVDSFNQYVDPNRWLP